MLCVPAESPDGSSRPAQGTNPHKHKTEWDGVHQASLNSTPEACKCTRRHGKHTGWGGGGGGWYYRIRVLALCSCAHKWGMSPGCPV